MKSKNFKFKFLFFSVIFLIILFFAAILLNNTTSKLSLDAKKVSDGGNINVPNHYKTLENNRDGTFTLELSVEGAIEPEQKTAKANVLVLYDVSGSMTNNNSYVYAVNPLGNYRRANNGSYAQLRNCNNGNTVDQGYQYDVCYYEGNRLVPYNGTRYIYTTRAAASEKAVRDFATQLYEFNQPKEEGGELLDNIQMSLITFSSQNHSSTTYTPGDETNAAWLEQEWTNDPDDFNSHLSATGYNNSRQLTYGGGTNWEAALQAAYNYLNSKDGNGNYVTDADPTYVLFVTDGSPTYGINTGSGFDGYLTHYVEAQDQSLLVHNFNTATHSAGTEDNPSNTMLYGIFTFGSSNDNNPNYLDDLIYYAHNNGDMGSRTAGVGSNSEGIEDVYFNASSSESLNEAIDTILNAIVEAVGVTEVSILDGTTNEAKLSSGEVAPLLTVDESTYKYWMSKDVYPYDPLNTDPDMVKGADYDYYTDRIDRNTGKKFYVYTKDLGNGKLEVSWTRPSEPDTHHTIEVVGTIEKTRDPNAEDPDQLVMRVQWKKHCTQTTTGDGTDDCGYSPEIFFNQDPPAAYLDENGAVQWDLSSVGTLLNGVTYSVSFDVWKTQMVFDLIADLNNGLVQPEELEDGYIDPETGTYGKYAGLEEYVYFDSTSHACENPDGCWRLRTNTTAELNYKDTREGDNPDEHEAGYTNPEGIEVFSNTITIEKDWKNYLDGADKELPDSVEVQLLMDGEPYLTTSLTKANEWKTPDDEPIFISYGIMRVDEETGKVEILDNTPGHDYSFTEIDDEHYNYQLVSETVHPMIYNGEQVRLVKVDANMTSNFTIEDDPLEDYEIPEEMKNDEDLQYAKSARGNEFVRLEKGGPVYYVRHAATAKLNAINYRRSNLNVYKAVDGNAPADQLYKFNITVNDPGNTEVQNGEVVPANLYFSVWDSEKKEYVDIDDRLTATGWDKEIKDSAWTGYYHGPNGSTITVQLKTTENLRFVNLTTQAEYTVIEDLGENSDFRFIDAEVSGTHKDSEGNNVELSGDNIEHTVTEGEKKVTGKIKLTNSNYYVEMKNAYDLTELPIEKIWDDNDDQDGIRPDSITVNLLADGEIEQENVVLNPTDNEDVTIDEDGNWHYTFTDLTRFKEVEVDGKITYEEIEYTVEEVLDDVVTGTDGTGTYSTSVNDEGNVITNKHTPEVTSATVIKVWDDNEDNDGMRPEVLVVSFDADNSVHTLSADNNWSVTIPNLPKYENGEEIQYTWSEVSVPDGYELTGNETENNVTTLTNKHTPETTTSTVIKVWDDDEDNDGMRPESLDVVLKDGNTTVAEETLNDANDWTATVTGLPKYRDGEEIVYVWSEVSVPDGYTQLDPEVDGTTTTLTNKHENETTESTVIKVWDDDEDNDGMRPDDLDVVLKDGDTTVAEETLNDANDWTATVTGLPKYRDGEEIVYVWSEVSVPDGYTQLDPEVDGTTTTLTNKHENETTESTVIKVWDDDEDNDGMRPDDLDVVLKDGDTTVAEETLNDANDWTATVTGLPKYRDGEEIVYVWSEVSVPDGYTQLDPEVDGTTTTLTNKHENETTESTVIKVWNDDEDNDGMRPERIVVSFSGDNTDYVLDEANNWTKTISDLPKYKDGEEIVYTWTEVSVPDGYALTTSVNGTTTTLTNTHDNETVSSKVTKVWDDDEDRDGKRQTSLDVTLKGDNTVVATDVLTEDNNWTATVTGLPKYKDGNEISYIWSEGELKEGYTMASSTTDPEDDTNTIITNHYDPEKTRVCIKKVWDDDGNRDGKRPLSLKVTLSNGQFVTLNADNDWYAEIDGLFKYENHGSLINYTWNEEDVEGYELTGNTTEEELTTLTNTYDIETTSSTVNKVWDDDDDNDGKRPETITVKLTADDPSFEDVTKTLSEDNEWTATVTGLPKYMNNGENEVTYTWSEVSVPDGYTLEEPVVSGTTTTLTNKHVPEKTEVPVKKIWDETNNTFGFDSPLSVKVNLLANGTKVRDVVLNANNEWKYVFEDLPKYDNKEEITYLVEEEEVPDYDFSLEGNVTDGFEITNTYNPSLVPVKVTKTWNDNLDQDGKRDGSIILILTGKVGEKVVYTSPETPVTGSVDDEKWYYTFEDLPEKYHGEPIKYSVTEKLPDGSVYTGENVSDVEIMNSYDPQTVSFNLTKIWDDDNDNDRVRPESITIHLLQDGVEIDKAVITEADNWSYSKSGLPKYRDHGVLIKYTIEEDVVEGYKPPVISYTEGEEEITSTITNPHENEKASLEIQKVWVDDNNKYKLRPKTITVQIFANGKLIRTIDITESDNWRKVISDLNKYLQGEEIEYTIIELPVDGYSTTIDGYTITNTILPIGKTEITPPNTKVGDTDTKSNLLLLIILLVTSVISAVTTSIKN